MFERCCDIEDVFEIKASLKNSGALAACMTGSGTAVFGIFENIAAADRAQQKISNPKWRSWTAVPVNRGTEIE